DTGRLLRDGALPHLDTALKIMLFLTVASVIADVVICSRGTPEHLVIVRLCHPGAFESRQGLTIALRVLAIREEGIGFGQGVRAHRRSRQRTLPTEGRRLGLYQKGEPQQGSDE